MSVEPAPSPGRLTLAELPDPGTATGLSNRPHHLSHSAASQWRKCGAQYAWLKDHPGGDRSPPATIRGQIAHGALEAAYSVVPPTCADDLLACLPAAIERFQREHESAPAFMALDNGERAAIVADAAECLNRLWEIDPHPIGPDITIVGTEVKVEALVGGVPFVAHVDLAYPTAGGELVLVDWKTGDQPSPRNQNDVTTQLLLNIALKCADVGHTAKVIVLSLSLSLSLDFSPFHLHCPPSFVFYNSFHLRPQFDIFTTLRYISL